MCILFPKARCTLVGAAFVLGIQAPLAAQEMRVALYVSPDTDGVLESQFRADLSALPDVTVVSREEIADVRLSVHAGCTPECVRAVSYWGSIQFTQVLQPWILENMVGSDTAAWNRLRPAVVTSGQLGTYERVIESGTFTWGGAVYEEEIKRYVASLDSRCFELHRLGKRFGDAYRRGDADGQQRLQAAVGQREWICDAAGIYRPRSDP